MLWKLKEPFHIYNIHDSFFGIYREILTGEVPDRITREDNYFRDRKGKLYIEDEHTYFDYLVSKEHPSCYQSLSLIDYCLKVVSTIFILVLFL